MHLLFYIFVIALVLSYPIIVSDLICSSGQLNLHYLRDRKVGRFKRSIMKKKQIAQSPSPPILNTPYQKVRKHKS